MTTDLTSESLRGKVSAAADLLVSIPRFVERCESQGEDQNPHRIAMSWLWSRLAALGIFQDEESHGLLVGEDCAEGDARRVLCENGEPNLPIVRFKAVWRILREKPEAELDEDEDGPGILDYQQLRADLHQLGERLTPRLPVGQWGDADLVKQLAERRIECGEAVVNELSNRARGRRFVAFSDEAESIVDQEVTLRLLREARRRETPVMYKVSDVLRTLYRAGEWPSLTYMECPLHPDVLLLDGYCDECAHTWEAVSGEAMQFVRLVRESGAAPSDPPSVRQLIGTALQGGVEGLCEDYPKVAVQFRERKTLGTLPALKRRTASTVRPGDPMNVNRRV